MSKLLLWKLLLLPFQILGLERPTASKFVNKTGSFIKDRKSRFQDVCKCEATVKLLSASSDVNPLNAELNPICHSLVLLGDLTFMGPCIVSIFQYISNKMQRYTVYLYLETAQHVSGGTSTHHQERIQLYLQHLVFVTPPTAHSNQFQLFHDSGR